MAMTLTAKRLVPLMAALIALAIFFPACAGETEQGVIKIGAAVSETGRYEREGQNTRQGYLLWRDWVNEEYGGIQVGGERYAVELVLYDDRSDPDVTAMLVERLIDEDEVDFLLGPYSSTLTRSAIEVAEERGVIMVEGNGASETLFQQSFKNLFAVLTPAGDYSSSALKALADRGARSVFIAHAAELFPTSVAEGAVRWAEEYGLEVLEVQAYPRDVTDVTGIVSRAKTLGADVFLGGGYFSDALLFVRTAKEMDFNPKAMALTVGPTDPKFAQELGSDADYLMGPTQWESSMGYSGKYFGTASDYAERYSAKWGEPPAYQAASATAAALALHLAIESADSLDADAVRAALRTMRADTFYGPISFDSTGKNSTKPMGAIQIQRGDIRVVAPAGAAVDDLIYPAPEWKDR